MICAFGQPEQTIGMEGGLPLQRAFMECILGSPWPLAVGGKPPGFRAGNSLFRL
jgi:hypothetical protein